MKYRVLIARDEDGVYVAEVPSLPGCVSQGATRSEALANVQEAIETYLESLEFRGEPVPPPIDEEVVEVKGVSVLPRISGREVVVALSSRVTQRIDGRAVISSFARTWVRIEGSQCPIIRRLRKGPCGDHPASGPYGGRVPGSPLNGVHGSFQRNSR